MMSMRCLNVLADKLKRLARSGTRKPVGPAALTRSTIWSSIRVSITSSPPPRAISFALSLAAASPSPSPSPSLPPSSSSSSSSVPSSAPSALTLMPPSLPTPPPAAALDPPRPRTLLPNGAGACRSRRQSALSAAEDFGNMTPPCSIVTLHRSFSTTFVSTRCACTRAKILVILLTVRSSTLHPLRFSHSYMGKRKSRLAISPPSAALSLA
mmetsp:Transcript_29903/g.74856  ORF Transcript_29903/g.74856 Transcript_29903/m.74856 type:complete len:211 (-) Transcript_29903:139-771(-)